MKVWAKETLVLSWTSALAPFRPWEQASIFPATFEILQDFGLPLKSKPTPPIYKETQTSAQFFRGISQIAG